MAVGEMTLTGDVERFKKLFGSRQAVKEVWKKAKMLGLKRTLAYYQGQIRKNIISSGNLAGKPFTPNSELTIAIKGSSKPLIDSGDMVGSVHPEVIDEDTGFVGLKRGETHKSGGQVADIAEIHEFGAIVKNHEVPKRPFIGPVLKAFKEEAGKKFSAAIEEVLNKP